MYEGHEYTLDIENAKQYGQYEFLDACKEMGIIKRLMKNTSWMRIESGQIVSFI